jgi:hypothetical protein
MPKLWSAVAFEVRNDPWHRRAPVHPPEQTGCNLAVILPVVISHLRLQKLRLEDLEY